MNFEILNLVRRQKNGRAIDIALPVFAFECEAMLPIENALDIYEETVLKLVGIGLSTRGIALTLHATESLVEEILEYLDLVRYVEKKPGEPWKLTNDGEKYLEGTIKERTSEHSKFGYMFVNTIKKDVLPFFYEGNIKQAPLFVGEKLPLKLTLNKNEEETFVQYTPKKTSLNEAFRRHLKNIKTAGKYEDGDITIEEAIELFEDLDAFDEVNDVEEVEEKDTTDSQKSLAAQMMIRALNCPPEKIYLTMRIIIDPAYPGGYRIESPFDLNGIDDGYFLRQVQWLAASEDVFLGEDNFDTFLTREIKKLAPEFQTSEIDFSVFALEKMPLLQIQSNRFSRVYSDMAKTYSLIQRQNSLLEKENIVSNISRAVVERLFNRFFYNFKKEVLSNIAKTAIEDLKWEGAREFKKRMVQNTHLEESQIYWNDKYIDGALHRMQYSKGNSIVEKFINVIVLNYYDGTNETKKLLTQENVQKMYDLADKLNKIRCKVSHDTDELFEERDYDFYMANVFSLINCLLEAYKEA